MSRSLAERLTNRDAERFIGREPELALFESILDGTDSTSVVFIHGPGGIGKSTLLREMARRVAGRGWAALRLDGRELASAPEELQPAFTAARGEERPVILLDTYEQVSSLDGFLRKRLIPELPERAIVVLAGREPPAAEWSADGWEHVARAVRLGPLSAAEGSRLVRAAGDVEASTARSLVEWSAGSPLALSLATEVALREHGWDGADFGQRPELVELLVGRLVGAQVGDDNADVTATAALARVTNAAMLAAVLPGRDPHEAYRWLRSQAITEPVGDGVAMHDLVRRAVRAHLSATRPERERELRRRIADHLLERARAGEPRLLVDLAELIDSPALRWGLGADGAGDLFADALRPGELDGVDEAILARGSAPWWKETGRLAAGSPSHVVVARDADESLRGLAIAFTPANATAAALADPYVGAWIAHARANVPDGNAIVWRDSLDFTASERGDLSSRVLAVVNTAAILRSGLVNPRFLYLPINPINAPSVAFARDSGAQHIAELDVRVGELLHECHVIDCGPEGLLGSQRDTIYAELGLPLPAHAATRDLPSAHVSTDDVRQALRDLDRPSALALNPLAAAVGGADPAAAVRALLTAAASGAFGSGPEETLMRDLVTRAYVDHRSSHEQAADELHVSRTTYFRRLRQATARVADYVIASLASR